MRNDAWRAPNSASAPSTICARDRIRGVEAAGHASLISVPPLSTKLRNCAKYAASSAMGMGEYGRAIL